MIITDEPVQLKYKGADASSVQTTNEGNVSYIPSTNHNLKSSFYKIGVGLICLASMTTVPNISHLQASSNTHMNTMSIKPQSGVNTNVRILSLIKETEEISVSTPKNESKIFTSESIHKGALSINGRYEPEEDVEHVIKLSNLVKSGKSQVTFKGKLPKKYV